MDSRRSSVLRHQFLVLPMIALMSTLLAFGVLHVGRGLVRGAGAHAVRDRLVRESDQIASQSIHELDQINGCRALGGFPLPYERCIALISLPRDSIQVTVRVEPKNRLIDPDSMTFHVARGAE